VSYVFVLCVCLFVCVCVCVCVYVCGVSVWCVCMCGICVICLIYIVKVYGIVIGEKACNRTCHAKPIKKLFWNKMYHSFLSCTISSLCTILPIELKWSSLPKEEVNVLLNFFLRFFPG
jgi:hypothetical protein